MTSLRLAAIFLILLTIYSLLSLSFNSWFHNISELHNDITKITPYDKYANAFQASFAFDILIFVWCLMGFFILRNPIKILGKGFAFFLFLLCVGKLVSTVFFLADGEIKRLNDDYANKYDQIDKLNDDNQNILKAWKVSFNNMYASVVIELIFGGFTSCFMMNAGKETVFRKVENPT